ncbi:MAG TPA: hypothetical protein PKZ84_19685 [Anaerolineae bacterium]|nr:hypothetical protein [Anaerolineae bacterium]HQI86845.1 hypothetical protein [Anaerolineae bacterium]
MEKQDAQAFRDRWQAVAEIEKRELQQASFAQRWRQFNAILQMALDMKLAWPEESIDEIVAVRQRWLRLQEVYL